jgi:hypothetical protein
MPRDERLAKCFEFLWLLLLEVVFLGRMLFQVVQLQTIRRKFVMRLESTVTRYVIALKANTYWCIPRTPLPMRLGQRTFRVLDLSKVVPTTGHRSQTFA